MNADETKSESFKRQIASCVENKGLFYIVLSRPSRKGQDIMKMTFRPLNAKAGIIYQQTKHLAQKVLHANFMPMEFLKTVWSSLEKDFSEGTFFTTEADYQVLINRKRLWTILKKKPTHKGVTQTHNRLKCHLLEEGTPIPFLVELGVMRADGSLVPKMAHKFKQINRFVEMISDVFPSLPKNQSLSIIDFGCGKSYLTFAIYHYLHVIQQRDVDILGLDLKADVISRCQALADQLGYSGLRFRVGDINTHIARDKVDMVVSLHACDTATDAALEKAIDWGARIILCVPCCQHELYGQVAHPALSPLLKHGILRERFAALVTDAARAQLLEVCGYRTQVIEFIDTEHTPKNLLIRAIRTEDGTKTEAALKAYKAFSELLKIKPCLEARLNLCVETSAPPEFS